VILNFLCIDVGVDLFYQLPPQLTAMLYLQEANSHEVFFHWLYYGLQHKNHLLWNVN